MRPTLLIVTDSRGKNFQNIYKENKHLFSRGIYHEVKIISLPGAKVNDLRETVVDFVDSVDSRRILIVKIFAGICDLTQKYRNSNREIEID